MNKIVLITGASSGYGKATAKAFKDNGDTVIMTARNLEKLSAACSEVGGDLAFSMDVTKPSDWENAVKTVKEKYGRLDVLVNNAGIAQIKLFTDLTDADWRRMIATNLDGAFYVSREVSRLMIRAQYGRIVNVGSMWGKCGASCEVHYSAAKAGLRGLTMALAKELGPSRITVNCVEPGVIETEMNAALDEETKQALCDETPLCRLGAPEEVADAILFLASDQAGFITGQTLGVDGGFAI